MAEVLRIIRDTREWLGKQGVETESYKADPASQEELAAFQQKTGLVLPASTVSFFCEQTNGIWFQWEKSEDAWGSLAIDSLTDLADRHASWIEMVKDFADDPHSMDLCIKNPAHRPAAFDIWNRMKAWLPLRADPEADFLCLDTSTGAVVINEHDWFDGFGSVASTNGLVAGVSIEDFIENWSRFCFRQPKGQWWGVFDRYGRVTWDPEEFDDRYLRD